MLHAAIVLLLLVFIGVVAATVIWRQRDSVRRPRFFYRGWAVVSLLWVAVIVAVRWGSIVAPLPAPPSECGHPGEMACAAKDDALVADLAPRELRPAPLAVEVRRAEHVAVVALLPPLALLGLWLAFARILRGFRRDGQGRVST
jgi:hypothetical protein